MTRSTLSAMVLAAILIVLGLAEGLLAILHPGKVATVALALAYGLGTAALILWGARPGPAARRAPLAAPAIIALSTGLSLLVAFVVLRQFALSADEFGYSYLADTLRHGRLWNPSFPPELQDVLQTIYVPDLAGKRLAQYPPGWPAILGAFTALGAAALANPLIGLLSAILLSLALTELQAPRGLAAALLAIFVLAPFAVFTNGTYFNHTTSCACLLGIAYLDIRGRRRPSVWNQAGIGLAFSLLLTTRYEVFAIGLVLYTLDLLLRLNRRAITGLGITALAAAPITAMFLYYNWRITGSPFTTTLAWGAPDITFGLYASGVDGVNTPAMALERNGRFFTWWAEFASCAILPFYARALWLRARSLRWFDLMLPAVVLFFVFYPDGGGFQYGPRYWLAGWTMLPLTLGAAGPETWRVGRRIFDPARLATLQFCCYAGFTLGYAVYANLEAGTRQDLLRTAAAAPPPAMVLFPSTDIRYVPWQVRSIGFDARDYTRNGPDGLGPVAFGRDVGPARTAQLCHQVHDRTIWRLTMSGAPPVGRLEPACNTPP